MKTVVVGGGPAGLMAAETLSAGGVEVDLYDAMPSVGRKFLMAGKGGLNITHSEPWEAFVSRYGARQPILEKQLAHFTPDDLRIWVHELGVETFVGTSGRVFPKEMKAAPLLRAWLRRLRGTGVRFHMRHRWMGWDGERLKFSTPQGHVSIKADAVVLALGGASWPQLGSDGAWVDLMAARGLEIAPLQPSNCGFDVGWSDFFREKYAGAPVKSVTASFGEVPHRQGEFVVTATGVEGSLIYALSANLRDAITVTGKAALHLDLAPGKTLEQLVRNLKKPRGRKSITNFLREYAGLEGVKVGLLREALASDAFGDAETLAATIKALPLTLTAPRPIAEAISTAGGVRFEALDDNLMLKSVPGVFCAGEMLDWDAPTGGYLLTACMALGKAAGMGALHQPASHNQSL
ncbi:MAG: TIGR03862 family flavoprotein [Rhodospirillaceae bacterium]|nr:TIGR03862 family flavoprotein [Rhodospirillaceae bacterium]